MGLKQRLARALDIVISPFAAATLPVVLAVNRLGEKAPVSRGLYDRAGIALVKNHYYTPIVLPGSLSRSLSEMRDLPGLDLNEAVQIKLLAELRFGEEMTGFPQDQDGLGYFYNAENFGPGDSEILYSVIRRFKPRRMVEIGSGQSTLMAKAAMDRNRDEGAPCEHVCIEPYEMPWLEQTGVTVVRKKVEDLDFSYFEALEPNDILFIDSSHVIRPQGDVLHEYLSILPRLKPGVLVHVHDIFTPFDYPDRWVFDWRLLWDEQYLLEVFLTYNDRFEVLLALNWLHRTHPDALLAAAPMSQRDAEVNPGSFWIRRK